MHKIDLEEGSNLTKVWSSKDRIIIELLALGQSKTLRLIKLTWYNDPIQRLLDANYTFLLAVQKDAPSSKGL